MALTKQLGLFWGEKALYFSENSDTEKKKIFSIPLKKKQSAGGLIQIQDDNPEEARILATDIQKAFKEHKISSSTVNLSLPTKDIIFRSFSIPWMPPNQMRQVVEFEAAKYLPFSLNDLAFAFHPIVITHNNTKRFRIIFVAIKKSVLENYKNILNEALLDVGIIEPAPVGLLRTLSFKKQLSPKDQYAIVEKEGEIGKITIIDEGIPQFVRDFNLRISSSDQEEISSEVLVTRLVNEIQVSLDYFNRIGNPKEISQIIFLTASDSEELSIELAKNLEIKVDYISSQSLLDPELKEIGYLNAFGIGLNKDIPSVANFDLSNRKPQAIEFNVKAILNQLDFKSLIPTILPCIALMFVSPFLSNLLSKMATDKAAGLKEKLGIYESMDEPSMTERTNKLKEKLDSMKNIPLKSDVSFFLKAIPSTLPKNAWLNTFNIKYSEKAASATAGQSGQNKNAASIDLSGYIYSQNATEQFRLANKFANDLKENKEFSKYFEKIDLQGMQAEKMEKYDVTRFTINCK